MAHISADVSRQIYYRRCITVEILQQMYNGRYVTTDTLQQIYCDPQKQPYLH